MDFAVRIFLRLPQTLIPRPVELPGPMRLVDLLIALLRDWLITLLRD